MELDLEPSTTTVATTKNTIIDRLKDEQRSRGERVLRDSLPASALMLRFQSCELGADDTLGEYGVKDGSTIKVTRSDYEETRKRYGRGWDPETKQQRKKQDREKRKAEEKAREEMEEANAHAEARRRGEEMAELLQKQAEAEMEALEVENQAREAREAVEAEEVMTAGGFVIGVDVEDRLLVEREWEEDPFYEEDEDKENWDPQILRPVEGNRRPLQAPAS